MAEPAEIPTRRMTVREFLAWADEQPSGRYELMDGQVVAMAPEQVGHVRTKAAARLALRNAVRAAGVPCTAYGDGLAVEVAQGSAYQPDALVNCGMPMGDEAVAAPNPVIIVEVLSPGTRSVESGEKRADHFRVPQIEPYLMIRTDRRMVVHHRRAGDRIETRLIAAGRLALDPPGLTLEVAALFGA